MESHPTPCTLVLSFQSADLVQSAIELLKRCKTLLERVMSVLDNDVDTAQFNTLLKVCQDGRMGRQQLAAILGLDGRKLLGCVAW